MFGRYLASAVGATALAACSPPAPPKDAPPPPAAGQTPADEAFERGTDRYYARRAFTIVYALTGDQSGVVTEHVRDWGAQRVEIEASRAQIAGMSVQAQRRVVFDGAMAYAIEQSTGYAVGAPNPFYQDVVVATRDKRGPAFADALMMVSGGRKTGERGVFAGYACAYWAFDRLNAQSCVADWGATLYSRADIGGIIIEKSAREVRLGDGGPDTAFEVKQPALDPG